MVDISDFFAVCTHCVGRGPQRLVAYQYGLFCIDCFLGEILKQERDSVIKFLEERIGHDEYTTDGLIEELLEKLGVPKQNG